MVMGLDEDPEDHAAVATSVFITVAIYGVREAFPAMRTKIDNRQAFFLFCGSQAWLNMKQSQRGAISLR